MTSMVPTMGRLKGIMRTLKATTIIVIKQAQKNQVKLVGIRSVSTKTNSIERTGSRVSN
jgi:hypothetical protein